MCGRYGYYLPAEAMLALFHVLNDIGYPPRYNIRPTEPIVIIKESEGRRTAELFRWGLVPHWVKDPREFPLLINARAESMLEKPAFRDAVKNSRCIVPASGYYEWMKGPDGTRRPYFITRTDDEPMAFAGLYSTWSGPDGEEVDTVAIVTVEPNLEISSIYDRMPAILTGDAVDAWLNTREVNAPGAAKLAITPPSGTMKYHPVGRAIGSNTAEGPDLILPVDPASEPAEAPPRRKRAAGGGGQLDLF